MQLTRVLLLFALIHLCKKRLPDSLGNSKPVKMSRVDSPAGNDSGLASSSQASPTSTASTTPVTQQTPPQPTTVAPKRSSFSISNLLAPEEEKTGRTSPHAIKGGLLLTRAEEPLSAEEANALHKSPFLNASALAHLAHLHGTAAGSTQPAAWDWLSSGLHPDSSALWSRFELLCLVS